MLTSILKLINLKIIIYVVSCAVVVIVVAFFFFFNSRVIFIPVVICKHLIGITITYRTVFHCSCICMLSSSFLLFSQTCY